MGILACGFAALVYVMRPPGRESAARVIERSASLQYAEEDATLKIFPNGNRRIRWVCWADADGSEKFKIPLAALRLAASIYTVRCATSGPEKSFAFTEFERVRKVDSIYNAPALPEGTLVFSWETFRFYVSEGANTWRMLAE